MLGKESIRPALMIPPASASFDPLLQGRQQALRPHRRLDPRPAGTDLSGVSSPFGQLCRCVPRRHRLPHPPSCAPWLHARCRRFPATMGALTPVRLSLLRTGIPASRTWPSRPFRLQPPSAPRRRFCTLPLSATGVPVSREQASPVASRLAATPRPNGCKSICQRCPSNRGHAPNRHRVRRLRTGRSPPVASHPALRRRSIRLW